jgi:hypothetical protein
MKRVGLFLLANIAVMLVLSISARILGIDRFLTSNLRVYNGAVQQPPEFLTAVAFIQNRTGIRATMNWSS